MAIGTARSASPPDAPLDAWVDVGAAEVCVALTLTLVGAPEGACDPGASVGTAPAGGDATVGALDGSDAGSLTGAGPAPLDGTAVGAAPIAAGDRDGIRVGAREGTRVGLRVTSVGCLCGRAVGALVVVGDAEGPRVEGG